MREAKKRLAIDRSWGGILFSTPRDLLVGWRAYVAEYIGTLILVLGGTGMAEFSCHHTSNHITLLIGSAIASLSFLGEMSAVSVVSIALGFAVSVAVGVYFAALTSGGHLNPAVTIAFMITTNTPFTTVQNMISNSYGFPHRLQQGLIYIAAQLLGAITASAILLGALPREGPLPAPSPFHLFTPSDFVIVGSKVFYGANMLTMNREIVGTGVFWSMPIGGAVLLEIATTFLLVSVIFAVARLRIGMGFNEIKLDIPFISLMMLHRPEAFWQVGSSCHWSRCWSVPSHRHPFRWLLYQPC